MSRRPAQWLPRWRLHGAYPTTGQIRMPAVRAYRAIQFLEG